MANANQAVAPAQSAVASATAELFGSAEIETIEQLGRDYWVAEDAKAKAERKIGSCDVALFDIVKGMNTAEVQSVFDKLGLLVETSASPEQFAVEIKKQLELSGRIVKIAGIEPE